MTPPTRTLTTKTLRRMTLASSHAVTRVSLLLAFILALCSIASSQTPPAPPKLERPHPPEQSADPDSPRAIDASIAAQKWSEALAQCQRVAQAPGDRDLGHFLYQYGLALMHSGRAPEAAVMFTRSAILFPDGVDAAQSLIQTAIVYRDEHRKPEVAKRLLQRAIDHATARDQQADAMLARELLEAM